MARELSIQIVPAPPKEVLPGFAQIVQRPDPDADEAECKNCNGNGHLPRGETCRKCGGSGRGKFVFAARLNFRSNDAERVGLARKCLRNLPGGFRIDRTVRLAESGGGWTNTGEATIVAGLRGERLPAVHGRPHCNSEHAIFWVHAALVVTYSQRRGHGEGEVRFIAIDGRAEESVGVVDVPLWKFRDGEDPVVVAAEWLAHNRERPGTDILFPAAAVAAAKAKARDYHCRRAYYVASGGAHGVSGPRNRLAPKAPVGY